MYLRVSRCSENAFHLHGVRAINCKRISIWQNEIFVDKKKKKEKEEKNKEKY